MTGEIFALLSRNSVLRHSIGTGWDDAAFEGAITEAMSRPEALANRFFTLRAEALLAGLSEARATARLSGLLIGAELAAAKPYWLGARVVVIGEDRLTQHSATARTLQGAAPETIDARATTLAGLTAAYARLKDMP
jgi:2-dehydro-3-deoxygalactonokinase